MAIEESKLTNVFQMLTERLSEIENCLRQQKEAIFQIDKRLTGSMFDHYGTFSGALFGLPFDIEYEHGWQHEKPTWTRGLHSMMVVKIETDDVHLLSIDDTVTYEGVEKYEMIHNRCWPSVDIWLWSDDSQTPAWYATKAREMTSSTAAFHKVICIGLDQPSFDFPLDEIILEFYKEEALHHQQWLKNTSDTNEMKSFIRDFIRKRASRKAQEEQLSGILKNHTLTEYYCG